MDRKNWFIIGLAIFAIATIDLALITVLHVNGTVSTLCIAAISALAGHPLWEGLKGILKERRN